MRMPAHALAAFATFVRARLADVGGTIAPMLNRAERIDVVIVTAAPPFAPNSPARARLLRQAHASGLLRVTQAEGTVARHTGI